MHAPRLILPTLALLAAPTLAQSDVIPEHKHAWGENIGWLNWRDAGDPDGAQGVAYFGKYLGGYVWGENVGWITVGDGSPANGTAYANTDGADSGVNINTSTGNLTGMAWGENIGWINFSGGALADPPQPARLDFDAFRLRGYAWGENVGWINLDDDEHFIAFYCPSDFNHDLLVNTLDVLAFLNAWSAGNPDGDFNHDGTINTLDVLDLLNDWAAGC